jgi:hypothetical protein
LSQALQQIRRHAVAIGQLPMVEPASTDRISSPFHLLARNRINPYLHIHGQKVGAIPYQPAGARKRDLPVVIIKP